jgi:hypothetical protein
MKLLTIPKPCTKTDLPIFLGVLGEGSAQEGKEGCDILFELEAWILKLIVPNCASSEDDAF